MATGDRDDAFIKLRRSAVNRLRYIEFLVWFRGFVSRKDIIDQYRIAEAAATKDFKQYSEAYPENLVYDVRAKRYALSEKFRPAFSHDPKAALNALAGIGSHRPFNRPSLIESDFVQGVHRLNRPEVVAALTRAISTKSIIRCEYSSVESGYKQRVLAPRAIATDGDRWHIRGYVPEENDFRDFTLARFGNVSLDGEGTAREFQSIDDPAWVTKVAVCLTAHPSAEHPESIAASCGLVDGELKVEIRCALLGYFLRRWRVDVTDEGAMNPDAYQLRLSNVDEVRRTVNRTTKNPWALDALAKEQMQSVVKQVE